MEKIKIVNLPFLTYTVTLKLATYQFITKCDVDMMIASALKMDDKMTVYLILGKLSPEPHCSVISI